MICNPRPVFDDAKWIVAGAGPAIEIGKDALRDAAAPTEEAVGDTVVPEQCALFGSKLSHGPFISPGPVQIPAVLPDFDYGQQEP